METNDFPILKFQGQLRPSQAEVIAIAQRKLEIGERRVHIVAPPGAGKTVLGLCFWAECVRRPALVLSPNSAIQAQWAARSSSFRDASGGALPEDMVSINPDRPGLLTSLTYQSVTMPSRSGSDLDLTATAMWVDRLIEQEHAESPEAANLWIDDLKQRSPAYFEKRLAVWRKQARDELAMEGQSMKLLHDSSQRTLQRLRDIGVGLIILDECHHLMGHWGRVLAAVSEMLGNPVVLGLTATPPDREGQKPDDVRRYDDYFGPIDFEVPVPVVVRDGFLAPYQDLAWIVRPTAEELAFVNDVDHNFRGLLHALCEPHDSEDSDRVPTLPQWVFNTLNDLQLPAITCPDWKDFQRRDPAFAETAPVFLTAMDWELPGHVPRPGGLLAVFRGSQTVADLPTEILSTVLDRYLRHGLRRSRSDDDQQLYRQAVERLRLLGIQVKETGSQSCASPVSRILGYTKNKVRALIPILEGELEVLDEDLRAVVITDYEKMSVVSADVSHVLDEEAGGAVAAFRELVAHGITSTLDPVLLTGSTILVDHDMADLFDSAAQHWLLQHGLDVQLEFQEENLFHVVRGTGKDWCPRVYIEMVTQLFQDGVTRCLVGTRGLLGEGWDANRINVLIDLTTVATSMTVNQLRGRSIRLDPLQPQKLANNWDVVCIAPGLARGLDDYHRFCQKHETIYGVTDDGAIEKGVGHVHAALTDVSPEGLQESTDAFNTEMLRRAADRADCRRRWKIGTRYSGSPVRTVELHISNHGLGDGFRPAIPGNPAPWTIESLGKAFAWVVLKTLRETDLVKSESVVNISRRDGGYVRIYLLNATEADHQAFAECLTELMSPFRRPRYLIPRFVDQVHHRTFTGWMPGRLGRYFETRETLLLMYHAIPMMLSRNKSMVEVFQQHWNACISTGEAIYGLQGGGQQLAEEVVKQHQMPTEIPHQRDCFL